GPLLLRARRDAGLDARDLRQHLPWGRPRAQPDRRCQGRPGPVDRPGAGRAGHRRAGGRPRVARRGDVRGLQGREERRRGRGACRAVPGGGGAAPAGRGQGLTGAAAHLDRRRSGWYSLTSRMSWKLKEKMDRLLAQEEGAVRKDWGGRVAFALVYPNTYRV